MTRAVVAVFALLLGALAQAQTACYEWSHAALGSTTYPTATGAATAFSALLGSLYEFDSCTEEHASAVISSTTCKWNQFNNEEEHEQIGNYFAVFNAVVVSGDCTPSGCNTSTPGVGETFTSTEDVSANNQNYCNTVSNCKMTVKSAVGAGGQTVRTVKHTTDACGSEPPMEDDELAPGETCTAVGDGEYCASPSGDGSCGYMNDTYMCLSKVKPNECKVLGDGARVCGAAANSTPPAPDNGTPGTPATPDGTLEHQPNGNGTPNTFNYFNSTTVAGSSRDPGVDGGAPSGGSPGGDEEGEESPGDGCEGEGCEGTLPELEEIGTVGDAFSGFWSELQDVPVIAAAGDIAPSFSGGSCPDWSTTVPIYSSEIDVDFSSMCTLWTDISPALTFVCLVMFGFLAFRVLFSA